MKSLVLTILGNDRPGIVESLSQLVYKYKGNWLKSSMSEMAGKFAGILLIQLPDEQQAAFVQALKDLDLQCIVEEAESQLDNFSHRNVHLTLVGNDKTGIIQEVTQVLSGFTISVQHLESFLDSAPNWGNPLFRAEIELEVPATADLDEVKHALEDIANDLVVDLELSQRL